MFYPLFIPLCYNTSITYAFGGASQTENVAIGKPTVLKRIDHALEWLMEMQVRTIGVQLLKHLVILLLGMVGLLARNILLLLVHLLFYKR